MPRGGYREGAGGKPKWIHGKTKTIRVPEALADRILEYARDLDKNKGLKVKENKKIESIKVIDLAGISLKAIDGQMGVKLSDLVKKGYKLIPDHLYQVTINALKNNRNI